MILKKKLHLLFVLIAILTGCNVDEMIDNKQTDQKEKEDKVGVSLGLKDESSLNSHQFTHLLNEEATYTPEISIFSNYPEETPYRLFFLLDYKQIPVIFEGETKTSIDLKIPSYSLQTLDIEVPDISNGLHDFLVILVRNPDVFLKEERYVPFYQVTFYRRVTLIVNKEKSSLPGVGGLYKVKSLSNGLTNFTFISKNSSDEPSGALSLINNFKEIGWINFDSREPNSTFFIGAFLNQKQIEIEKPYIKSSDKGSVHYPIKLKEEIKPSKEGNLFFFVVENPFKMQENFNGELKNTPLNVYFTNRLTLAGK